MKSLETVAELLAFGLGLVGLRLVLGRVTKPIHPHVRRAFDWTFPSRLRKIAYRVLDHERPLLRRTGWKRALARLAFFGFIVLGFWGTARAWGAYRFRHDWYLIEPPFQFEAGFTPDREAKNSIPRSGDPEAMLRNMKPNFDAPTQCWDIQNTYHSKEACQDVLKINRTSAATEVKAHGDPLNVAPGVLAERCIAVADPKAPPPGGLFCMSPSEWQEMIQRSLSRRGTNQTKQGKPPMDHPAGRTAPWHAFNLH